jgi:hypothetical protein
MKNIMKIKSEKDQILERLNQLDKEIDWQKHKENKVYKKLREKQDFLFPFWILNNESTLLFIYNRENDILNSLEEYRKMLDSKLTDIKYEKV